MINSIDRAKIQTNNSLAVDLNRADRPRIIAAIDIGTNSIHMVIVKIESTLPTFTIIAKEKDTVRLGEKDENTGDLTPQAIDRSLSALKRCKDLADSLAVEEIIAVATSATREANNGQDFLKQIESEIGITVNLISGQEEARRIYLGVLSGMDFGEQPQIIVDIGGGSTELVLADVQEPRFLSSTKVGAVRLTSAFVTSDPISEEELNYLKAYVRGMLERSVAEIWGKLQLNEAPGLIGTSGTIETLATIHANWKHGSVPNPIGGYQMSRQDLKEIIRKLARMTCKERLEVAGIADKRAEIIVPGAIILLEVMTMLKLDSITICERALREGMIVDWMLTHGLIESRLSYQHEVKERNVIKIAKKYRVNLDYGEKVAYFALSLFEQTQGYLHDWGSQEKELLWAAAILHNSGVYISHSSHHKHSYYLIRNADILGFTELELELIANLARYHRKSKPKKKHDNYHELPNKHYQLMVRQLSAILRLAVALDRRKKGAIASVNCYYYADNKELHLHLFPKEIGDDCALELWSLNYKKDVFEEEYDVSVVATVAVK